MKNLAIKSQYVEVLSNLLEHEFGKPVTISEFHELKLGDGNSLFYVILQEGYKLLVDIVGKKPQENMLLFWVESIDHAGKLDKIFYGPDVIVTIFSRGEKFNNEYLVYLYSYPNTYPSTRFVTNEMYSKYVDMMSQRYKAYNFKLPEGL